MVHLSEALQTSDTGQSIAKIPSVSDVVHKCSNFDTGFLCWSSTAAPGNYSGSYAYTINSNYSWDGAYITYHSYARTSVGNSNPNLAFISILLL